MLYDDLLKIFWEGFDSLCLMLVSIFNYNRIRFLRGRKSRRFLRFFHIFFLLLLNLNILFELISSCCLNGYPFNFLSHQKYLNEFIILTSFNRTQNNNKNICKNFHAMGHKKEAKNLC